MKVYSIARTHIDSCDDSRYLSEVFFEPRPYKLLREFVVRFGVVEPSPSSSLCVIFQREECLLGKKKSPFEHNPLRYPLGDPLGELLCFAAPMTCLHSWGVLGETEERNRLDCVRVVVLLQ